MNKKELQALAQAAAKNINLQSIVCNIFQIAIINLFSVVI